MKRNKAVIKIFSVLAGLIFLAGSTGVTVITHHCAACNDHTTSAGFYLVPSEPKDDCCEAADRHCEPVQSSQSLESGCCHFRVGKLQLTNYTYNPAPEYFPQSIETEAVSYLPSLQNTDLQPVFYLPYHNKHGGRYLLANYCRLII